MESKNFFKGLYSDNRIDKKPENYRDIFKKTFSKQYEVVYTYDWIPNTQFILKILNCELWGKPDGKEHICSVLYSEAYYTRNIDDMIYKEISKIKKSRYNEYD